jgi:hypothetical protein
MLSLGKAIWVKKASRNPMTAGHRQHGVRYTSPGKGRADPWRHCDIREIDTRDAHMCRNAGRTRTIQFRSR